MVACYALLVFDEVGASYLCLVIWVWIFGLIALLADDCWFIVWLLC